MFTLTAAYLKFLRINIDTKQNLNNGALKVGKRPFCLYQIYVYKIVVLESYNGYKKNNKYSYSDFHNDLDAILLSSSTSV